MNAFDFINDLVETFLLSFMAFTLTYSITKKKSNFVLLWCILSIFTILSEVINFNYISLNFICIGVIFLLFKLCSKQSVYYLASVSMLTLLFLDMTNSLSLILSSIIFDIEINQIYLNISVFHLTIILSKVMYCLFIFFMYKTKKKYMEILNNSNNLWKPFCFSIFIINVLSDLIFPMVYAPYIDKKLVIQIITALSLLIFCFCYLFLEVQRKNQEYFSLQLSNNLYANQLSNYQKEKEIHQQLREMRHNQKQVNMYLINLLQHNEIEKTIQELQNQDEILNQKSLYKYCENQLIDMVVKDKISIAKSKNIKISCNLKIPETMPFENIDIYILLGNLLDNSIEHCGGDKQIKFIGYLKENDLHFYINNTIDKSILTDNPDLNTSKKDKQSHGLGILSCQKIVSKYHGAIRFTENDAWFICHIVFDINVAVRH